MHKNTKSGANIALFWAWLTIPQNMCRSADETACDNVLMVNTRRDHLGITVENMHQFDAHMAELAEHIRMWPPLNPLKRAACKWNTVRRLDRIARCITKTARPTTVLWNGGPIQSDKVYKRCYGAYQDHVYIPIEAGQEPTVPALLESSKLPGRHWMVQDWISPLRDFGEFKVYVVNTRIVHIAFARYSAKRLIWDYIVPESFYTLAQLRYVRFMEFRAEG